MSCKNHHCGITKTLLILLSLDLIVLKTSSRTSQSVFLFLSILVSDLQPPEKPLLKSFAIFTEKHLCWSCFLIKLQALQILPIFCNAITVWKVNSFGTLLVRIFPYSDWIRENTDQKNSEYGDFPCSECVLSFLILHFWSQSVLRSTEW